MTNNDTILTMLTGFSDSQLAASMTEKLRDLIGKPDEEVKTGLHEILDRCAYGALASDFVMRVLDGMWRELGGQPDDPAPWREGPPWVSHRGSR